MSEALLRVRDLRVHFGGPGRVALGGSGRTVRAVDGVDLDLARGETLGLVGESGSGKTTTGRAIVRLLDPTGGSVVFDGREITDLKGSDLRRLRRRFQMVFQDPYSSLNPRMTVGAAIAEPLHIHGLATGAARAPRIRELLGLVGLPADAADRFPHEFSGGQRQRIGIARALAADPELIVADEPISALDVSVRAQILNLLRRIQRELGLSYIVVAHDLAAVRQVSDRVAVMYLGEIVETAPADALYAAPRHPYTVALLSAVPIPDPALQRERRRIILVGDMPDPADPPPGCRFHTRCFLYERLGRPEVCRTQPAAMVADPLGHAARCHFQDRLGQDGVEAGERGAGGAVRPATPDLTSAA